MDIVNLLDTIRQKFTQQKCKKLIDYDTSSLKIQTSSEQVLSENFSLADFPTEINKIREFAELSQLLDDYQFHICQICQSLWKEDLDWKNYTKIRVGIIALLTQLQITLINFRNDPEGYRTTLDRFTHILQDYLMLISKEVIPNIDDFHSKSYVSKGDVIGVSANTLSKAIQLSGLENDELNKFVEELKSKT